MQSRSLYIFAFLIIIITAKTEAQYQVSDNCLLAWEQLMDLKLTSAKNTLNAELKQNPTNYYAYYLEQCVDALALVAIPSKDLYQNFEKNFDRRMAIMEEKDMESPYYFACRSEMLLQMCIFNVLHGDKISGVRKGYRAYKATYRNREKYPDFAMSKKMDGFFNVAVSNMPSFVRWAATVFGVSGNADNGVNILKSYYEEVKHIRGLNLDAAIFVILPYKLNKEPAKAYSFINTLDTTLIKSKLINYFYINTAYRSGRNELAYNELQHFDISDIEFDFLPYDYMMGKVLLRKLDTNAIDYLQNYLRKTKDDNYIKETFNNIASYYLVHGNKEQFKYYKQMALENGKDVNERDRESLYDSKLDYIPDINLTRAKLLTDGGYFEEGIDALIAFEKQQNEFLPYQLENQLIKGRLLLARGNKDAAISAFKKVVDLGEDLDYYFASEAALRLGWIYLESDKVIAKDYFEECLDLYQSNFYEYIEEIANRELKLLE